MVRFMFAKRDETLHEAGKRLPQRFDTLFSGGRCRWGGFHGDAIGFIFAAILESSGDGGLMTCSSSAAR